ncbi:MAG: DUF1592 domain-containing protein [Rhodobacteraceae bacterium]|nr:DUF1592 domain-containing protein [Paracoccaceae bacterium]
MKKILFVGLGVLAVAAAGGVYWTMKPPAEPPVAGGPPTARLISNDQYHNAVSYIFGSDIAISVKFPPMARTDGLVALGAAQAQITNSALELYDQAAREIAAQVTSQAHRDYLLNCAPAQAPDEACAKNILARYGRLLFRRALTDVEMADFLAKTRESIAATGDFYAGIATGLSGLMISPQFIFLIEETEPDPKSSGKLRLAGSSVATRLSLLLWDAPPDDELLAAAENGELYTEKGIAAQVDRMLVSPRLEKGVRSFFTDMMIFEKFDTLTKDPVIYPAFTSKVAGDAMEETLLTLIDHLIVRNEDYRDIFTTRRTFINGDLGMIYRIPVQRPQAWQPYEFAPDSGRAGILTQLSFLSVYSHPGRSSPTIRGKGLREVFLCQIVPPPPPDVDFSGFEAAATTAKSMRERLEMHRTNPTCAGCHKITDPIGLSFENFDGSGAYRTTENGYEIDASGDLGGVEFKDAIGLGQAMHDDPSSASCVVNRLFDYGRGYKTQPDDYDWLHHLDQEFAESGYRLPALLKSIATSQAFYAVSPPIDQPVETADAAH